MKTLYHTDYSTELLKEIQEKTNILWNSGEKPTETGFDSADFLILNINRRNGLTWGYSFNEPICKKSTPSEFLAECVRISPKKER